MVRSMKLHIAAIALLALVTGCKSKLAGTYHGDNHQTAALNGTDASGAMSTSSLNDSSAADVVISESGDTLAVDYRGCHFEAQRTSATQASAKSIDCPFPNNPGVTFHADGAVLTFVGDNLSWSWMGTAKKGDASGSFTSGFSGTRK